MRAPLLTLEILAHHSFPFRKLSYKLIQFMILPDGPIRTGSLIYGNNTLSVWRWLDRDRSQLRSWGPVSLGTALERCRPMADASG